MIILSAVVSAAIVILICLAGIMGWTGRAGRLDRIGLCVMGAGLVWAGPARALDQPAGLGDLLFVSGLLLHLWAVYGPGLWQKADGLDGKVDGIVSWPPRRAR